MTSWNRCAYCGWKNAQVRREGEPPTCATCAKLPAAERARDAELERAVDRYYEGDAPAGSQEPSSGDRELTPAPLEAHHPHMPSTASSDGAMK